MSATPLPDWIEKALPLLCCPDTRQSLRIATPEECAAAGLPQPALARQDGSRLFRLDDGVLDLLPERPPEDQKSTATPQVEG